jgi:acyl-coenzyme A synthetase/AMP-(fatty) acid ligase
VDHQIKVHGHRVELGEIEAALREESGIDAAVAVGWPNSASGASAIEAFLGSTGVDLVDLDQRLRRRLPDYMVPRRIHLWEALPLNANGKYDRKALNAWLEESK